MSGYDDLRAALVPGMSNLGRGARWPCADDPDLWFCERPDAVETAKQICQDCPVHRRCLAAALARREPCGVWGGEILHNGVIVARRPRGRPPKKSRGTASPAETQRDPPRPRIGQLADASRPGQLHSDQVVTRRTRGRT